MNSLKVKSRQAGFVVAVAALLLALVVPTFASAADVTTRSIALTSASKGAEEVTYTVNFTTATAGANAFVVDFCDSPAIGAACTPPTGMDASEATTATSGYSMGTNTANTVFVESDSEIAGSADISVALDGITNPSNPGTVYARIVTFDTEAHAAAYSPTAANGGTGAIDTGSVGVPIHDTIAVSAAVQESMTFCVSNATILANCAGASTPVLNLGEGSGATKALSASAVSTGDLFAQISTNAATGAVVNLKSSATGCGGLVNSSKPDGCYIGPAADDFLAGQALFGLKVVSDTDPSDGGVTPSGAFNIVTGSGYSDSAYFLSFDGDDESEGVTSVFGDPILDTAGSPASNKNKKLTFGASISNSTPAGKYSASLSLIATGKF